MSSLPSARQPVGWFRRTMCLLTLHTHPELPHLTPVHPANPCRREPRCDCGRTLLPVRTLHEYGEAGPGDRLCELGKVCVRCGHTEYWLAHTTEGQRLVQVRELPPHVRRNRDTHECRYAVLCVVCGEIARTDERHDWHEEWWGRQCRHCGLRFLDAE